MQTRRGSKLAESKAVRDRAIFWWNRTVSTRGNDPKTAVKIIVMQRLNEDDLIDAFVYAIRFYLYSFRTPLISIKAAPGIYLFCQDVGWVALFLEAAHGVVGCSFGVVGAYLHAEGGA